MKTIPVDAVAGLFLSRQHLDRPLTRPFTQKALTRFVEDAGGLQLDSINVVERAHYAEARTAIFRFIEGWYNPHRRHSALRQQSPVRFESLTPTAA